MSDPILQLKNIRKNFGAFEAIKDISLDIEEGEFLTIVGPSGSGKTTLIRLMVGMDEPSTGEIWLRNERIEKLPANKRPTCMVFQSLALFPHRSVGENIEFSLKIRGVGSEMRREKALELLDLLRLPQSYYGKRIHECSGGERQRVALARALAFDPEILFFDEPLSALDYRLRKTLEKELKALHEKTGKTFVYITHSLEEAMVMSDRIAIMKAGVFEQIDPAREIYSRPVSRFVAEFMGEVNLIPFRVEANGLVGPGEIMLSESVKKDISGKLKKANATHGTIVVRPEFITFGKDKRADFSVGGQVLQDYELGSRIQYEVEAIGMDVVTVEKLRVDMFDGKPGDQCTLSWAMSDCHLIVGE